MIIYILIEQEFIPNRLLNEAKQIVQIILFYCKGHKYKYRFENEKIQIILFDIENHINIDRIKDIILSNKIKFSKSIYNWPSIILNIHVNEINHLPSDFIHEENVIEKSKILYEVQIGIENLPVQIHNFLLKELNLIKQEDKYYAYSYHKLENDSQIFLSIINQTINNKINDILFFIQQDQKINNFDQRLNEIIYFQGAGSILDKTNRLVKIANKYNNNIIYAAQYSKYDLCTSMISEYPKLQGIIGSIYFKDNIIQEQYIYNIEKFKSDNGMFLALIDNVDKVCAYIAAGARFTSSRDPFALKRAVQLSIKIIIEIQYQQFHNLIEYIATLNNLDINIINEIVMKQLKVIYKNIKPIITDDLASSIKNILYFKNNTKVIGELKTIYTRLSPMTDQRTNNLEYSHSGIENNILDLIEKQGIKNLKYDLIDQWISQTYIADSAKQLNLVAYILYQIEASIDIHLYSSL